MKIGAAQIRPVKGDINKNIETHLRFIEQASSKGVKLIFFPELSLTGYEPALAGDLAVNPDNVRFEILQTVSDSNDLVIGAGLPIIGQSGIYISMVIFSPCKSIQVYSKQFLHSDEKLYFVEGKKQLILDVDGIKIAPAICYESLLPEHSEQAAINGADIYFASVAKPLSGIDKVMKHFPEVAENHSMTVMMCNCVGQSDGFNSVGSSAVWSKDGSMIGQLDTENEGLIIYDTNTNEISKE